MKDFPEWLKEALQKRFDDQAYQSFQSLPIRLSREKAEVMSEQIKHSFNETEKADFLRWEEECSYLHGQELGMVVYARCERRGAGFV